MIANCLAELRALLASRQSRKDDHSPACSCQDCEHAQYALEQAAVNALPALLDVAEAAPDVCKWLGYYARHDVTCRSEREPGGGCNCGLFEVFKGLDQLRTAIKKLTVPNENAIT